MNGLLNLAFPVFNAIDSLLAVALPAVLRVVVWGGVSGALAMGLYWLLSDQEGVRQRQARMKDLRAEMKANEDDFQKVMALSRQNLKESFGLLGRVLGPGLLSGLPVLFVIAWISAYYTYATPAPGTAVALQAEPADSGLHAEPAAGGPLSLAWPAAPGEARLVDKSGPVFAALPLAPPVNVVHKPAWWNWLWGNPAGYLDAGGATEAVTFALDRWVLLPGVPGWMDGWEFAFFASTILVSIVLKVVFKIA